MTRPRYPDWPYELAAWVAATCFLGLWIIGAVTVVRWLVGR